MASKKPMLKIQTPVGDLNWMFITGEGKEDLNGNPRYSASVYYDKDDAQLKAFIKKLEAFWEENKPKGSRKAKSMGVYTEVKVPDAEAVDGFKVSQVSYTKPLEDDMEPTGRIVVSAWTGVSMPDGKPKHVKTYNAKAAEVSLGDKVIGPGSRGALTVACGVYDNGANKGLSLYLNGVVISKFVELQAGDAAEAIDDEDGWTGEDLNEDGAMPLASSAPAYDPDEAPTKAKVKL